MTSILLLLLALAPGDIDPKPPTGPVPRGLCKCGPLCTCNPCLCDEARRPAPAAATYTVQYQGPACPNCPPQGYYAPPAYQGYSSFRAGYYAPPVYYAPGGFAQQTVLQYGGCSGAGCYGFGVQTYSLQGGRPPVMICGPGGCFPR